MLELRDFFHLPQVDAHIAQLVRDRPGMVLIAGLDPRQGVGARIHADFYSSGRATIFNILLNEILAAHPSAKSMVIASDRPALRKIRKTRNKVEVSLVRPPATYESLIQDGIDRQPDFLAIDRLSADTVRMALEAAGRGTRILAQFDTAFWGAGIARHLVDIGIPNDLLGGLTWILTVQRIKTLCQHCKHSVLPDASQLAKISDDYPSLTGVLGQEFTLRWVRPGNDLGKPWDGPSSISDRNPFLHHQEKTPEGQSPGSLRGEIGAFFEPSGCEICHNTGRSGDLAVFDFFRNDPGGAGILEQRSLLPLELYVLYLACLGRLSLKDFINLEANQFHQAFNLLKASELSLLEAKAAAERKLIQFEAANRVLQQRTEALISLQDISQAMIASTDLDDLASRLCRRARDLCGADRVILYYQRSAERVEILAAVGWDPSIVQQSLNAEVLFNPETGYELKPFSAIPPGVLPRPADLEPIRAGLSVPLIAQDERVGLMIVHTLQKASFSPGEAAMLRAFANQAALAVQRAGLIEQLRSKIAQLEAAQVELAQKERLDREMELAREVQQSVLPRTFPVISGFHFAAQNETARQVGGDFYDVIAIDADHFGVAVADVSDKGMPAALYMALSRSLLSAEARRTISPLSVLSSVNQLLLELGEPNMFVTVFYGVIERITRRLTYAIAGHDRPLLIRDGLVQQLGGRGVPLGILADEDFVITEQQLELAQGDRLVLYTDGLVDILSPEGELFGLDRFKSLIQSYPQLTADRLCDSIFSDLAGFQGDAERYDDMTILIIDVDKS